MKGNVGICVGLLFMVMNSGLYAADTDEPGLKTKEEELKELAMDYRRRSGPEHFCSAIERESRALPG
jgi:hypothetical protein